MLLRGDQFGDPLDVFVGVLSHDLDLVYAPSSIRVFLAFHVRRKALSVAVFLEGFLQVPLFFEHNTKFKMAQGISALYFKSAEQRLPLLPKRSLSLVESKEAVLMAWIVWIPG